MTTPTLASPPSPTSVAAPQNPLRPILAAGLLCGVLDLAYVIVFFGVRAERAGTATFAQVAQRIPKGIAAGLVGSARAQAGGGGMIALGVACHFAIACGAAAVFYAASRRARFLVRYWPVTGPLYGVAVWLFIQLVVLPLSAVPPKSFPPPQWVPVFMAHLFCVGLPIAWAVRRSSK
jgi:hypothetical protein